MFQVKAALGLAFGLWWGRLGLCCSLRVGRKTCVWSHDLRWWVAWWSTSRVVLLRGVWLPWLGSVRPDSRAGADPETTSCGASCLGLVPATHETKTSSRGHFPLVPIGHIQEFVPKLRERELLHLHCGLAVTLGSVGGSMVWEGTRSWQKFGAFWLVHQGLAETEASLCVGPRVLLWWPVLHWPVLPGPLREAMTQSEGYCRVRG